MLRSGRWLRTRLIWLVVILAIGLVILLLFRQPSNTQQVTVSTMLTNIRSDIQRNQTDRLEVGSDALTLTRGKSPIKEVANINSSFSITTVLKENGIDYTS